MTIILSAKSHGAIRTINKYIYKRILQIYQALFLFVREAANILTFIVVSVMLSLLRRWKAREAVCLNCSNDVTIVSVIRCVGYVRCLGMT